MRRFIRTGIEPSAETLALAKELCISEELACALYNRGAQDADSMRVFLHPGIEQLLDPFDLPDMEKAVRRIQNALAAGERICVYGDYDVDGICATTMLLLYFRSLGADVMHYIPSRHGEGYGMNAHAVAELKKQGIQLIITVDNGISALGEIALCRELAIDVVVTDHHHCMDTLPDCVAVVNPARPDSEYGNPFLCGAGVALKLIEALAGRDIAQTYLPLAGLATVADVVPLYGENRALTALTLNALNQGKCPVGMLALAREANEKQLVYSVRDLSFGLAPRLNAAGRLGDAEKALSLLCQQDPGSARAQARELSGMNSQRQEEERKILAEAEQLLKSIKIPQSRAIVLYRPNWNSGIVGIVASRLTERYYRPVFLFCGAGEEITGSGRSIPGVNLFDALKANEKYFIRFGGHAGAAGATMKKSDLADFVKDLDNWLHKNIPDETFIPACEYEFEIGMERYSLRLAEELERLAPFGEGNPVPSFYVQGMRITNLKYMGQEQQHIRFSAVKENTCLETVAFQWGSRMRQLPLDSAYDMVFHLSVNEWQGRSRLQLMLTALEQDTKSFERLMPQEAEHKFFDAILQNVLYNGYIVPAQMPKTVNISLPEILKEDVAGSLVLCFTPAGAQSVLKELTSCRGRADVSFSAPGELSVGYNAVVFAPVIDRIPFWCYDRILLYDRAPCSGFISAIMERSGEGLLQQMEGDKGHWSPFKNCNISREGVKKHYRALFANKNIRYPSKGHIVNMLMEETQSSYQQCAFAVQVFTELAFLCRDGETHWKLDAQAAQRQLEESDTYAFAYDKVYPKAE